MGSLFLVGVGSEGFGDGAAAGRAAAGGSGQGFSDRLCAGGVRGASLEAGGAPGGSVGGALLCRLPRHSAA